MKMCRVNRQLNRQRLPSNSGVELGAAARVVVEKSSMAAGATSVSGDDAGLGRSLKVSAVNKCVNSITHVHAIASTAAAAAAAAPTASSLLQSHVPAVDAEG